jgi:hypothetical protein
MPRRAAIAAVASPRHRKAPSGPTPVIAAALGMLIVTPLLALCRPGHSGGGETLFQMPALGLRRRKSGMPSSMRFLISFPHASHPCRAWRANSSILGNSGYICSISS